MARLEARVLGVLLCGALAAYGGPALAGLGLYHDDWAIFSLMRFGSPGSWGAATALAHGLSTILFRPLSLLLWPPLFSLFGAAPLPWQLTLLAINTALAFATFRLLRLLERPPALAALGALLVLAYPAKDATLYWPVAMVNPISFWLFLEATLAAATYAKGGKPARLAAALGLLVASFGLYDQTLVLWPAWLLWPGTSEERGRLRRSTAAAAAAAAAYLTFKFGLAPRWAGPFHQPVAWSISRLGIYAQGAAALLGPATWTTAYRASAGALRHEPIAVALALAAPAAALWLAGDTGEPTPRPALAWLGSAFFVLGYAPLLPSDYAPDGVSLINRVNLPAVLGLGLFAVAGAERLGAARGARSLAAAAALCLMAQGGLARWWAESYRRQLDVRKVVLAALPQWPAGRTLLVYIPERFVEGKVIVFDAHWDIGGAVQLWTGDPGRTADMWSRRQEPRPEGLLVRERLLPYDGFTILDVPSRRIAPATYERLKALPRL